MEDILAAIVGLAGFVLGAVSVAGLAVVEWAAWVIVLPNRRPGAIEAEGIFETDPTSPERRLGAPIEAIAADGVRLAGLWHAAGDEFRHGRTILLVHGFAEDPSALQARMEALNRHGWDVAVLDTRAHGRSGGDRGSFGGREAGDLGAWIDVLVGSGKLQGDAPVVAVWGRSMGAAIALRAAAEDSRIAALVIEAPYLDLEMTLRVVLRRKRMPMTRLLASLIMKRARRLSGLSLANRRPIDLVPKIQAPVLVIHGANDSLIPVADIRRLAGSFPRPASLVVVAEAGHNSVVEVGGPELLERIARFLDNAVRVVKPR